MWKIWVITVIPFECHVHLNISSFSSAPCFLISSNCPLYKINHFGLTSGIFFSFWNLIFCARSKLKTKFQSKTLVVWYTFYFVFCRCIKWKPPKKGRVVHLFCIPVLDLAYRLMYAVLWLHWAGIRPNLAYIQYATCTRSWIFDACTYQNSLTQSYTSRLGT